MQQVVKILTHRRDVKQRIIDIDSWNVNDKDKEDIKEFLEAYRQGEITGRIGNNIDVSIERIIQYLKIAFVFLSKKKPISSFNKNNIEDVKKFKKALLEDKIKQYNRTEKKYNGNPYAIRSKKMILYTFGQYLKWKLKPEYFIVLSKPLLVRIASKESEPDSFNLKDLDKLYNACSTDAQRFLIINLFSSGTRAEEFHNIRFSDVTLPKQNESFVKIRIRHGFSKTKGRTITMYHPQALKVARDYLELRKGMNPEEPLLLMSYDTGRKWLKRLGQRVLKRNLYYHLFRSSCATWLATRMNRQQLCIFFGWKFNSPMPDIYISRSGLDMEEVSNNFQNTEIEELKNRLEKEEHEAKIRKEELEEMKKRVSNSVTKEEMTILFKKAFEKTTKQQKQIIEIR